MIPNFDHDREKNYIEEIKPKVSDKKKPGAYNISYHWALEDGRHIFLYVFFSLKLDSDNKPYLLAKTNIDSEDVRGQGAHIIKFLTNELMKINQKGYKSMNAMRIIHMAQPNEHAEKYFVDNPDYEERNGAYYRVFD